MLNPGEVVLNDPKDKIFERLLPMLNYLWKNRLDQPFSELLTKEIKAGSYKKIALIKVKDIYSNLFLKDKDGKILKEEKQVHRDYVFLNAINYPNMEKRLKTSKSTIQLYMNEFVKMGILKKFRKFGPNEQMVYAMGYFSPYKGGNFTAKPFLINSKKFREALINFNPYPPEKEPKVKN